jgi:Bacterial TniB protein
MPESPVDLRNLSAEERIKLYKRPLWIPFGESDRINEQLEDMLGCYVGSNPAGMTLWGPKGAGKTTLLQRFSRRKNATVLPQQEYQTLPVVYCSVPAKLNLDELYNAIWMATQMPSREEVKPKRGISQHQALLERLIALRVQMVIVDEIHSLMSASDTQIRLMMQALSKLSDLLSEMQYQNQYLEGLTATSWVLAGTDKANNVIAYAPEFHRRFTPREFPIWQIDNPDDMDEMGQFLADLEAELYLREESNLSDEEFLLFLYRICSGYRSNIVKLVIASAVYCLRQKKEKLTQKDIEVFIKKYRWKPPSELTL